MEAFNQPDPGHLEYIPLDYRAAYSQLARKFTILAHTLNPSDLSIEGQDCLTEAIELIKAVEKTELTVQIIKKEES